MERFVEFIKRFVSSRAEEGQDFVEYAMLIALIAIAVGAGLTIFATDLTTFFTNLYDDIPLG